MKYVCRVFRKGGEVILAAADSELIGKKLDGNEVRKDFYGEETKSKEIVKMFSEATSMNLLGKEIVELAVNRGFVEKDAVKEIDGVPHALYFKV